MLHTTMFLGYVCYRLGTYFHLFVGIGPWEVVEHVNGLCFRGIYESGLWKDDLLGSALLPINFVASERQVRIQFNLKSLLVTNCSS